MKTRAAVLRQGRVTKDMMDGKNIRGVIIHEH